MNIWKSSSVGYCVVSEKHIPHNMLSSHYFGNARQRLTWGWGYVGMTCDLNKNKLYTLSIDFPIVPDE